MSLVSNIKDNDSVSIRQAIAKLGSIKLGTTASPIYAGLTLTGLTDHSLIYVDGGGVLTSLGTATDGQLPIGDTGGVPVLATLTGTAKRVSVTSAAGSITLSGPQDLDTVDSPTFTGLNFLEVSELPSPITEGKIIRLVTDNRLYFGKVV
jgi:hypothetical protein